MGQPDNDKEDRLLGKLGQLKVATALSEAGLLTAAEKAGVFSQLEEAGAFSQAEKLLPIVDKLGVFELLQNSIETEAGLLRTGGLWLFSILPIYSALASQGFLPGPEGPLVLAEGL